MAPERIFLHKNRSSTWSRRMVFLFQAFLFFLPLNAQDPFWKEISSPVMEDLFYLENYRDSTLLLSRSNLFFLTDNEWKKLPAYAAGADQFFVSESDQLFINKATKYQESELYRLEGREWIKIDHPMVNKINSIYFRDASNGVIAGLGEIASMQENRWENLPPPTIRDIRKVILDQEDHIYALCADSSLKFWDGSWKGVEGIEQAVSIKIKAGEVFLLTKTALAQLSNGKAMHLAAHPDFLTAIDFDVLDPSEFIVVGEKGLLLHYKEGGWTSEKLGIDRDLLHVTIHSAEHAFVLGREGLILEYAQHELKSPIKVKWKGFEAVLPWGFAKMIDDEYGVVIADFNKDALPDIFTSGLFEAENLYINQGDFIFLDQAEKFGLNEENKNAGRTYQLGACAGDVDNDGDSDLYIAHLNGRNRLMINMNGNKFRDLSEISHGTGEAGDRTNSVLMADVDNDGDLDIFLLNEYTTNRLYLNNGAGIYRETTLEAGLGSEGGGMCGSFGDLDNDGDVDLFISNWSKPNALYLNQWKETGTLFFKDHTSQAGVGGESFTKSNGVQLNDLDQDGDLDIFVANRKFSNQLFINQGGGLFEDKTEDLIGKDSLKTNGVVIEDLDGDGFKDIYLSNVGPNTLFKGQEDGTFQVEDHSYGLDLGGYSTGLAIGDLDLDRDYDIYVANYIDGSSTWFRNNLEEGKFMPIFINAYKNNRSGVGSKIYTYRAGALGQKDHLLDFRQLTAGQGYASMNELRALIPVRGEKRVDIKVEFPNGITKIIQDCSTNESLVLSDVDGWERNISLFRQGMIRTFKNPHRGFEISKMILVICLLGLFCYISRRRFRWRWEYLIPFILLLGFLYFIQVSFLEYEPFIYSSLLPILSVLAALTVTYLINERRWMKRMALHQQKEIRDKLARDLHDDLAATISTTGIYLSLIQKRLGKIDPTLQNLFDNANNMIANAGSRITDLIWAVRAREERLGKFISRVRKNFSDLFFEKSIHFHIDLSEADASTILSYDKKQNLYLIIKEALNNVLKHASASQVKLHVGIERKKLWMTIEDDGKGLSPGDKSSAGFGLENMKKRAEEIGGMFEIEAGRETGTRCIISIPL